MLLSIFVASQSNSFPVSSRHSRVSPCASFDSISFARGCLPDSSAIKAGLAPTGCPKVKSVPATRVGRTPVYPSTWMTMVADCPGVFPACAQRGATAETTRKHATTAIRMHCGKRCSAKGMAHSLVSLWGSLVWRKVLRVGCFVGVVRFVGLSPRRTRAAARFSGFMMQPFLAVLLAASVAAVA